MLPKTGTPRSHSELVYVMLSFAKFGVTDCNVHVGEETREQAGYS